MHQLLTSMISFSGWKVEALCLPPVANDGDASVTSGALSRSYGQIGATKRETTGDSVANTATEGRRPGAESAKLFRGATDIKRRTTTLSRTTVRGGKRSIPSIISHTGVVCDGRRDRSTNKWRNTNRPTHVPWKKKTNVDITERLDRRVIISGHGVGGQIRRSRPSDYRSRASNWSKILSNWPINWPVELNAV